MILAICVILIILLLSANLLLYCFNNLYLECSSLDEYFTNMEDRISKQVLDKNYKTTTEETIKKKEISSQEKIMTFVNKLFSSSVTDELKEKKKIHIFEEEMEGLTINIQEKNKKYNPLITWQTNTDGYKNL